jgi:hypothetical protein
VQPAGRQRNRLRELENGKSGDPVGHHRGSRERKHPGVCDRH